MKTNYTICYVSKSDPSMTEADIQKVFKWTNAWNNKLGVRGILLHAFGNFFQVLEGEEKVLLDLYENKIKEDSRHSDIYEVYNKKTTQPVFTEYSSQFNVIKSDDQLDEIKTYLEENRVSSTTSDKLARLLKPFVILD